MRGQGRHLRVGPARGDAAQPRSPRRAGALGAGTPPRRLKAAAIGTGSLDPSVGEGWGGGLNGIVARSSPSGACRVVYGVLGGARPAHSTPEVEHSAMKAAVIVFPGSNCDRDVAVALEQASGQRPTMVWHRDSDFEPVDLIVLP